MGKASGLYILQQGRGEKGKKMEYSIMCGIIVSYHH